MPNNNVNGQTEIVNITVVTDERQIIVPQAITSVVEVNSPGPQGPIGLQGIAGPSEPFANIGNGVYATTSSLQVSGSFLVSGSSTFTNIGPAIFSGSVNATGNVTVLGTASINVLQINNTLSSTGSISGGSFIKIGGTNSQFLKADGSVDSSSYTPTSRTITINGATQDLSADRSYSIDKASVGLGNVDNTSDLNKPVSTATQTALNLKEDSANKQNSLAVDGTGLKFPTVDAINIRSEIDYRKKVLIWFSDFVTYTDFWFATSAASFTIRPASEIPFRTNQIGVGLLQSGASASTALFLTSANLNFKTIYLGQGKWNYETSILIPVLSYAASRYRIVCGFGDNNGSAFNEADGVFFIYDEGGTTNGNSASPNWRCITSADNVRTNSNTIPVVENTWLKLRFEVNDNASEVKFFVNGTLIATHTTNIPTIQNSRTLMVKQGMAKSAPGTINTTMWMDYIGYENILTTTR